MQENSSSDSQLEGWFRTMMLESQRLQAHPAELLFIEVALRYLHVEARTTRSRRDHGGIKRVWLILHPYLEKHGFMAKFKNDVQLRNRVTFFVKNGFGI